MTSGSVETFEIETVSLRTVSEVIGAIAAARPMARALIFLENGEQETGVCTYEELHCQAQKIACSLKNKYLAGERVLLMFHSGIDYVASFLGCLYAGVIAIPLYPPRNNWHSARAAAIACDAGAKAILTMARLRADIATRMRAVNDQAVDGGMVEILAVDDSDFLSSHAWVDPALRGSDLAYLQYTSGSTDTPRGVMVSHRNLLRNCAIGAQASDIGSGETFVSWLPIFHDMGLVQGMMMPLTLGGTVVFMPPAVFVQKPVRWLRAISRYRAGFSSGPNFAYELCVSKIPQAEREGLDLSHWQVALNGSEPIALSTLRKFSKAFQPYGFSDAIFTGGYGLAEATLYVTCGRRDEAPAVLYLDKAALTQNRAVVCEAGEPSSVPAVSSGRIQSEPLVRIVSLDTGRICEAGEIGEIWVSGESVCQGYWQRPAESIDVFAAALADEPGVEFMRTGDLGFTHDDELYVTGRIKDLIIIRGVNYYPQDIEATVENVHADLRKGGWGAAFTLRDGVEERLVIVQEVERSARRCIDAAETGAAIARAVSLQHGIDSHTVVFVAPGGVPRTSSGKIQRRACRDLFLAGELEELGRWERHSFSSIAAAGAEVLDPYAVQTKVRQIAAGLLYLAPSALHDDTAFSELGLDSVRIVEFVSLVSEAFGVDLAPSVAFDHPTIAALSAHLTGLNAGATGSSGTDEHIAIIGMDCRLPGANGTEEFWQLLATGKSAIKPVSAARRQLTGFGAGFEGADDVSYRFGGFLDDIQHFDAGLFGIAPREAQSIDPQQRLLLQTAWHALETANIPPDSLAGTATGVFVGVCASDYFNLQRDAGNLNAYSGTGNALSIAANRISYVFGLQGPSMAIDTACSSSLVAVHQACRSLACGESTLALVGGVNLILNTDHSHIFSQANMLSPSGQCRTFDDGADGYVRGEGCGVVVLKKLTDAVRDGDPVLAVIRGSAVNQDGHSNGLTAPNGLAQQRVITMALARAGVPAASIAHVETHGTGTPLGDPIEVQALQQVLGAGRQPDSLPCWLGAVKTSIGHLEPASGIAGLIKTVLVLNRRAVPPNRNFATLNRHLRLDTSRLVMPTTLQEWPASADYPRRAGVSAFGFGGTNAHLVIEEYMAQPAPDERTPLCMPSFFLALSAKNGDSLAQLAAAYAGRLAVLEHDPLALRAVCRAGVSGRAQLPERWAVVAATPAGLISALHDFPAGPAASAGNCFCGRAAGTPRIAFLFTGQGSQYLGMGVELYQTEPVFREAIDRYDALLAPLLRISIRDAMFEGMTAAPLEDTRYAQPALLVLQLALVALWAHWGIAPEFVIGHSIGEYAAACVAGLLDAPAAVALVAERGRLMASAPGRGAMLSVDADWSAASVLLDGIALDLAAVNAPGQCVLSGDEQMISAAETMFIEQGIAVVRLQVSHGFHSRMMAPVLAGFAAEFGKAVLGKGDRAMFIPTGGSVDADPGSAAYWIAQMRAPVRFNDALERALAAGADTFIEIGPRPTLSRLGQRTHARGNWIAALREGRDAGNCMRAAAGALFVLGAPVNLRQLDRHLALPHHAAPLYPFERTPFWFERRDLPAALPAAPATSDWPGRRVELAFDGVACFETSLPDAATAYLLDHGVFGQSIMPAAGYLALARDAAKAIGLAQVPLMDIHFLRALPLADGEARLQTLLVREMDGRWTLQMASRCGTGDWQLHVRGVLNRLGTPLARIASVLPASFPSAGASAGIADFYALWAGRGLAYGPCFQAVQAVCSRHGVIHGRVSLPRGVPMPAGQILHPVLLDGAFQLVGHALQDMAAAATQIPVPAAVEEIITYASQAVAIWLVTVTLRAETGPTSMAADLAVYDSEGQPVAHIRGLMLRWIDSVAIAQPARQLIPQCRRWQQIPSAADTAAPRCWRWLRLPLKSCRQFTGLQEPSFPVIDSGQLMVSGDDTVVWEGMDAMLAELPASGGMIVQLPLLDSDHPVATSIAACRALQQLIVMLDRHGRLPDDFSLCVLTSGATSPLPGDTEISVAAAGATGLLKSASLEYPHLRLRHLDLPVRPDGADRAALAHALALSDEISSAIRHGAVYAPRLQPLADSAEASLPLLLDVAGAYLVTGGTGALGLHVAEWLAASGASHIVLASRQARPGPHGMARIEALRQRGVHIELRQADLEQHQAALELVRAIDRDERPLRGVVHAAGVSEDQALLRIDAASWQRVFDGKAQAALWLDEALASRKLDFFIGFSSVAAEFGSAGQSSYAAANALLDAVLLRRHARTGDGCIVHWGPWAGEGMANDARLRQRWAQQGITPLNPATALAAMSRQLQTKTASAIIADIDWSAFSHHDQQGQGEGGVPAHAALCAAEVLMALDGPQAQGRIADGLAVLIGEVLKMDAAREFADRARFCSTQLSSLGVDSLMGMELRNRVRAWVKVDLPAHVLIGGSTVQEVIEMIQQKLLVRSLSSASTSDDVQTDDDAEVLVL